MAAGGRGDVCATVAMEPLLERRSSQPGASVREGLDDRAQAVRHPPQAGEHARGGGARRRRDLLGFARPVGAPGRQRRDARARARRGRPAGVRAGLPGPEPASRRDAVGRLRRRRHLEPAHRDHHLGRRVGAAPSGLLDAADELRERPRARCRAHPVLPGASGRRDDPVARQRAPSRRRSTSWPRSTCRSS